MIVLLGRLGSRQQGGKKISYGKIVKHICVCGWVGSWYFDQWHEQELYARDEFQEHSKNSTKKRHADVAMIGWEFKTEQERSEYLKDRQAAECDLFA